MIDQHSATLATEIRRRPGYPDIATTTFERVFGYSVYLAGFTRFVRICVRDFAQFAIPRNSGIHNRHNRAIGFTARLATFSQFAHRRAIEARHEFATIPTYRRRPAVRVMRAHPLRFPKSARIVSFYRESANVRVARPPNSPELCRRAKLAANCAKLAARADTLARAEDPKFEFAVPPRREGNVLLPRPTRFESRRRRARFRIRGSPSDAPYHRR